MIYVSLGKGKVAIIDDEDAPRVLCHTWLCYRSQSGGEYAKCHVKRGGKKTTLYLHQLILDAPSGKMVDHRNGNGLDNRRENLRLASRAQNRQNSRLDRDSSSGYKGVRRNRRKWQARINVGPNRITLGSFNTKEDAARAYDAAAKKHYGEFARVNFPGD